MNFMKILLQLTAVLLISGTVGVLIGMVYYKVIHRNSIDLDDVFAACIVAVMIVGGFIFYSVFLVERMSPEQKLGLPTNSQNTTHKTTNGIRL